MKSLLVAFRYQADIELDVRCWVHRKPHGTVHVARRYGLSHGLCQLRHAHAPYSMQPRCGGLIEVYRPYPPSTCGPYSRLAQPAYPLQVELGLLQQGTMHVGLGKHALLPIARADLLANFLKAGGQHLA